MRGDPNKYVDPGPGGLGRYRAGDRVRVSWVDFVGTLEWTPHSGWTLVSDSGERASTILEDEVIGYAPNP